LPHRVSPARARRPGKAPKRARKAHRPHNPAGTAAAQEPAAVRFAQSTSAGRQAIAARTALIPWPAITHCADRRDSNDHDRPSGQMETAGEDRRWLPPVRPADVSPRPGMPHRRPGNDSWCRPAYSLKSRPVSALASTLYPFHVPPATAPETAVAPGSAGVMPGAPGRIAPMACRQKRQRHEGAPASVPALPARCDPARRQAGYAGPGSARGAVVLHPR
jgi:hypothetical protein